jgi:hypothetical protein
MVKISAKISKIFLLRGRGWSDAVTSQAMPATFRS